MGPSHHLRNSCCRRKWAWGLTKSEAKAFECESERQCTHLSDTSCHSKKRNQKHFDSWGGRLPESPASLMESSSHGENMLPTNFFGRGTEDRGRGTEDGERRTENGGRRTEDGERRTENGERRTDHGHVTHAPLPIASRDTASRENFLAGPFGHPSMRAIIRARGAKIPQTEADRGNNLRGV